MVPSMARTGGDVLDEAVQLITAASRQGIPLRLLGGLAVRYLCPAYPPRARVGQDVDMASVSSARSALARFLAEQGCVPDREFNQLYGHKQMYFLSADGTWAVDVMIDRLDMCHVLDFKDRIERMPHTLDPTDLLLSKLQIVEINEKDLQDAVYLLSAFPVQAGDAPGTIGLERFIGVLSQDWGWWRTVSANLDRVTSLGPEDRAALVPADAPYDPLEQAGKLRRHADVAPKGLKWRLRSKIGDRVRWYKLPEEIAHH
jgi:hypothetical protein